MTGRPSEHPQIHCAASAHPLPKEQSDLLKAAKNAAATIGAVYTWLERVEKAGGATSMEGVAACHAMLTSLRKNADRTERLVMVPLRAAIAAAEKQP